MRFNLGLRRLNFMDLYTDFYKKGTIFTSFLFSAKFEV